MRLCGWLKNPPLTRPYRVEADSTANLVALMRKNGILLALLMVFASISPLIMNKSELPLDDATNSENSTSLSNGWGEALAGTTLTNEGIDWELLPERGIDEWVEASLDQFSESVEDIDVAIGPNQDIKACGYNADSQDLEVFTMSPDGTTTRVTVDSQGDVGRGCSIVIDYRGFARIVYLDVDASSLKIVRENDWTPAPDDDWLIRTLVNNVNITSPPEIAIYSNGTEAVAYRDSDTGGLHLTRFTSSWWRHTLIRSSGVGENFVLNIDVEDVLHLSFLDTTYNRVAVISLTGDDSTYSVVDEGEGIGNPLGHHLDATGRAQLVYGIENGTGLRIVRDLTGRDDARITPEPLLEIESTNSTNFGIGADASGDYNNDGYSDLIYGEPGLSNNAGAVHIHYGSMEGYTSIPDLTFLGTHADAFFGSSISGASDINGDGYDDILVAAPGGKNDSNVATGSIHLYTGHPTGLSNTSSWTSFGQLENGEFGSRLASLGDVNDDGFSDFAVTEMGWTSGGLEPAKGRVLVFYGNTSINESPTIIEGEHDDLYLGWSIVGVGDANGDGFDDLAIGSSDSQIELSGRGEAQVHYGSPDGISSNPSRVWSMSDVWTLFGHSLSALGDVNNDGYSDLAISEIFNNSVWFFEGSPTGFSQNPTTILTGSDQFGYQINSAGDVNDDGIQDFLVGSPGSGTSGGKMELFLGTNTTSIFDETSSLFTVNGASGQHLGKIISSGGDADRDGTHEFLYASSNSNSQGSTGGSITIMETRDWELADLPFDFTVNGLDLSVDAQGRTQLLLDTNQGTFHYERANEGLTSADPWGATSFGGPITAGMTVTPAGQPIVVTSDGGLTFMQRQGGVLLQEEMLPNLNAGAHGSIAIKTDNRSSSVFTIGSSLIFANQTDSALTTDVVGNTQAISSQTFLFLDSNQTPHILWLNSDEVSLAVQNGSSWDTSVLLNDVDRFAGFLSNGNTSIALMTVDTGVASTHWFEGSDSNWVMTEQTILHDSSLITVDSSSNIAIVGSGNTLEVAWLANNSDWQHQSVELNNSANIAIPDHNGTSGNPIFSNQGLLLPGVLNNTFGSHILIPSNSNNARTVDLGCNDDAEIVPIEDENTWIICTDSFNQLVVNEFEGKQPITVSSAILQGSPVAAIDSNGTWYIQYQDSNGQSILMNRWSDFDRDFVPNLVDDLPMTGGQWNDHDGDGYGDNPDAPAYDQCKTLPGASVYGHYGCADGDNDGFANSIDDCANSGKSWRDTIGCPDNDGDGWSDPNGQAGWDGDRHPTNWMQSIDTDGDGRYDNHGPDCCGSSNSDEFPLDPQQWEDLDGDGFGDNSSAETGDKCPGLLGTSIYDRRGCLDSDGDGWSDPEPATSQNPEGWTYNRIECHTNGTHCADLWPWAPTDTSAANICGILCNQQWADRDGDGYGDNNSYDAWNRDAFPDDPTQFSDADEDGWGDNANGNYPDDCPLIWGNSTADLNGCVDTDGDGHSNTYEYDINPTTGLRENEVGDALPNNPEQWRDRDGDGFGENALDAGNPNWDRCQTVPGFLNGQPGPGCPLPQGDDDGDGVVNGTDACPDTPQNEAVLVDTNGCSPSQLDDDQDGVTNANDICNDTPLGEVVDQQTGCSNSQTDQDSDNDGVNDIDGNGGVLDLCPNTSADFEVDTNGCADYQKDTDEDGITDDIDECKFTTLGATVDQFGCIVVGADTDGDGYEDAFDAFPSDDSQWQDTDGDGYGDNWGEMDWDENREGTVGEWVYNAQQPDACPFDFGTSWSSNRALLGLHGCPDTDGDGVPDPTLNWTIENGADYFPNDPTQYGDYDNDSFGDNPNGNNGDFCPETPGVIGGIGGNGCPPGTDTDGDGIIDIIDLCDEQDATGWDEDSNGCIDDNDSDGVLDNIDSCPDTPEEDWFEVDPENGCTDAQLEGDSSSIVDGSSMKYILVILGVILALAVVILAITRLRNRGFNWDDDDLLDDDDDWQDETDEEEWSPFGNAPPLSRASASKPQKSENPPSRGPPSTGPGSRGPPTTSRQPERKSPSFNESKPTNRPGMRPSGPTRIPTTSVQSDPVRKTRKTSQTTSKPSTSKPVRRTRKTSMSPAEGATPMQKTTRRTRKTAAPKTTRRKKASDSWEDLFAADEKADFDNAVAETKERLIIGDSDTSVLSRLQSSGWTPKQSKHILGHARN